MESKIIYHMSQYNTAQHRISRGIDVPLILSRGILSLYIACDALAARACMCYDRGALIAKSSSARVTFE